MFTIVSSGLYRDDLMTERTSNSGFPNFPDALQSFGNITYSSCKCAEHHDIRNTMCSVNIAIIILCNNVCVLLPPRLKLFSENN